MDRRGPVLIVEDSYAELDRLQRALENQGVTNYIAVDTYKDGLRELRAQPAPAVVIVDLFFPESATGTLDNTYWGHELAHIALADEPDRLVIQYTGRRGEACDRLLCSEKNAQECAQAVVAWRGGGQLQLGNGRLAHERIPRPDASSVFHDLRHKIMGPFLAADLNAQILLLNMEESERHSNTLEETASALRAGDPEGPEKARKAWSGLLNAGIALPDGDESARARDLLKAAGLPDSEDWDLLNSVIKTFLDLGKPDINWGGMNRSEALEMVGKFRRHLADLGQKLDEVVRYLDEKCGAHRTPS